MSKLRVGVVRGGPGSEYYVSLKTGGSVLAALSPNEYDARDVLITNDGQWHIDGVPTTPEKLARSIDVAFNALHGEFGEDGKIQKIFDIFGVPYTGSTVVPSAVGMNKELAKRRFAAVGIKVPRAVSVSSGDETDDVLREIRSELRSPYIVKPASSGSSVGVSFARTEDELISALERALAYGDKALVEEYIRGREITVGVVDAKNGGGSYLLPPLEVFLPDGALFDYQAKYGDNTYRAEPAHLSGDEYSAIERAVSRAHKSLGVRHYARYDFILADDGAYLLEVNTLPALMDGALLPRALTLHDLSMPDFVDYVISLALQEK